MTLDQGDTVKGRLPGILGRFPTLNGSAGNVNQTVTDGLETLQTGGQFDFGDAVEVINPPNQDLFGGIDHRDIAFLATLGGMFLVFDDGLRRLHPGRLRPARRAIEWRQWLLPDGALAKFTLTLEQ